MNVIYRFHARQIFLEVTRISKVRIASVERDIIRITPLIFSLKPEIPINRQEECVFVSIMRVIHKKNSMKPNNLTFHLQMHFGHQRAPR